MKTPLALLALSCATATALAAPPTPTPAPTPPGPPTQRKPACTADGDLVLAIQRGTTHATDTRVFANGGWTFAETVDGKPGRQASGCVARADLTKMQTSLANAPWKITTGPANCKPVATTITVFTSHGKPTFTDVTCSGTKIDDATRVALVDATENVDALTAEKPMPCCKH